MPQAQLRIVAQFFGRLLGSSALRRTALVLVLPFVGVLTSFGIAPDTVTDTVVRTPVVEDVALAPAVSDIDTSPLTQTQIFWHEELIRRGDTLAGMLARLRVNDDDALSFINSAPEARVFFQLTAGRTLRAATRPDGTLLALQYLNGDRLLAVTRDGDRFVAAQSAAALDTRVATAAGVIRSSLFASTDALDVPDAIAMQLVDLFSTEIDFRKDLRKDDRFTVIYEVLLNHGERVGAGRVLSAEFINQGRKHNVVWFETTPGQGAYYTPDGRDIRKSFLRSPLEFSRVSSGFTEARYHPILHRMIAHKGVDFVAPIGTNIKATADGTVEFAGVQSGYGNVVILRHQNKYTTLYAHMARFSNGIRPGAKVQQGDIIGAVGMTGMTTGPHVHYEFRIDGVHHNPLSVAMPTASPMPPALKQKFLLALAPFAHTMDLLRESGPATFE